jgi:excisionase family DNA binding protein
MANSLFGPGDTWLTVKQAAQLRGLTYRRLIQWIRDGLLPSSKPGGDRGQHLVRLSDLGALLAAYYTPATHGPLAVSGVTT